MLQFTTLHNVHIMYILYNEDVGLSDIHSRGCSFISITTRKNGESATNNNA